jgi:hypothetical protein
LEGADVGLSLGFLDGLRVGLSVGLSLGFLDGLRVGLSLGLSVGFLDGLRVGLSDGLGVKDGLAVGAMEGLKVETTGGVLAISVAAAFAVAVAPVSIEFVLRAVVKPPDETLAISALLTTPAVTEGVLVRIWLLKETEAAPWSCLDADNLLAGLQARNVTVGTIPVAAFKTWVWVNIIACWEAASKGQVTPASVTAEVKDTTANPLMVGRAVNDGRADGLSDGLAEGLKVGMIEGPLGLKVGDLVNVGLADGLSVGFLEGRADGLSVGLLDGFLEGRSDGLSVGFLDGFLEGRSVGLSVGFLVQGW